MRGSLVPLTTLQHGALAKIDPDRDGLGGDNITMKITRLEKTFRRTRQDKGELVLQVAKGRKRGNTENWQVFWVGERSFAARRVSNGVAQRKGVTTIARNRSTCEVKTDTVHILEPAREKPEGTGGGFKACRFETRRA